MNKRGQSIIEYVLIAVLVILGIYVMGPYVLRSIGAHFKLWDDGIKDSFQENLAQAPVNDIPEINASCNCPVTQGACGLPDCPLGKMEMIPTCDPVGCGNGTQADLPYCTPNQSCCRAWQTIGCGTAPVGTTPPTVRHRPMAHHS